MPAKPELLQALLAAAQRRHDRAIRDRAEHEVVLVAVLQKRDLLADEVEEAAAELVQIRGWLQSS